MATTRNSNNNTTTKKTKKTNDIRCSFCGKHIEETAKMFSTDYDATGKKIYICDKCIDTCNQILVADKRIEKERIMFKEVGHLPTPEEIKKQLDDYVVGQENAKVALSVAVYNHYKRLLSKETSDVGIQKSNVLLLGPSGCGKTLLAQTLAKILNVPFAIADATTLTEAGYVGEDVENVLLKLIQAADGDVELAERGIVYIDEIDKIGRASENRSITRDVSGEGVQQALLKIIEGTTASVPPQGGRKHPQQEMIHIDTSNILFIFGGAFIGMDEIVGAKEEDSVIGFGASVYHDEKKPNIGDATPDDFVKFGLIPELIGRIPIVVGLDALTEETLIRIMTEPHDAIVKQYTELLRMDNVELIFEEEALREIAHTAIKQKTGARSLRSVIEKIMRDVMFRVPSDKTIQKCIITKESVTGADVPKLVHFEGAEDSDTFSA